MQVKTFIATMGIGAVAGAAAVLMMPKDSKAYRKVDHAAQTLKSKISDMNK